MPVLVRRENGHSFYLLEIGRRIGIVGMASAVVSFPRGVVSAGWVSEEHREL